MHPSTPSTNRIRSTLAKSPSGKYDPSLIPRGPRAGLPRRAVPNASRHITPRQVQELVNVEAFAEAKGIPFAVHVILHWRCAADFVEADWQERLTRFLDKLHRWMNRRGVPYALAWLNENGSEYGQHTHIALHLPHQDAREHQAVVADLHAWIVKTEAMETNRLDRFGKPWLPVRITGGDIGMRNRKTRAGLCRYWVKSIDPKDVTYTGVGAEPLAEALNVEPRGRARPLPPGVQRFGASRNLGSAARLAAGWRELVSVEELRNRLNPA